jgi:hypothetical protein
VLSIHHLLIFHAGTLAHGAGLPQRRRSNGTLRARRPMPPEYEIYEICDMSFVFPERRDTASLHKNPMYRYKASLGDKPGFAFRNNLPHDGLVAGR